ncbi:alpha/beta hydrolase, partial [archaeon]|nr:alpha/beta hydrolase [archaeon]
MKKKLTFQNSKGDKLVGILSDSGSKTIVIMCHGFTSSKESGTYINLEKMLNEKGIATFRFDFYGHGESDGKFE